jgi:hypothetical protein
LQQSIAEMEAFDARTKDAGAFVVRALLHGVESATVVRECVDGYQVTDGAYRPRRQGGSGPEEIRHALERRMRTVLDLVDATRV